MFQLGYRPKIKWYQKRTGVFRYTSLFLCEKMNQKTNHKTKIGIPALTPLIGIGVFVICYVLATLNYPGGNWSSPDHESFSIWHNYLCDLLDSQAINGEENSARPYAISALLALCLGLFTLWIRLPALFIRKSPNLRVMKVSGLLALATIFFLALGSHDTIVRIAGFFWCYCLYLNFNRTF